jgi:hypothetical protein
MWRYIVSVAGGAVDLVGSCQECRGHDISFRVLSAASIKTAFSIGV